MSTTGSSCAVPRPPRSPKCRSDRCVWHAAGARDQGHRDLAWVDMAHLPDSWPRRVCHVWRGRQGRHPHQLPKDNHLLAWAPGPCRLPFGVAVAVAARTAVNTRAGSAANAIQAHAQCHVRAAACRSAVRQSVARLASGQVGAVGAVGAVRHTLLTAAATNRVRSPPGCTRTRWHRRSRCWWRFRTRCKCTRPASACSPFTSQPRSSAPRPREDDPSATSTTLVQPSSLSRSNSLPRAGDCGVRWCRLFTWPPVCVVAEALARECAAVCARGVMALLLPSPSWHHHARPWQQHPVEPWPHGPAHADVRRDHRVILASNVPCTRRRQV